MGKIVFISSLRLPFKASYKFRQRLRLWPGEYVNNWPITKHKAFWVGLFSGLLNACPNILQHSETKEQCSVTFLIQFLLQIMLIFMITLRCLRWKIVYAGVLVYRLFNYEHNKDLGAPSQRYWGIRLLSFLGGLPGFPRGVIYQKSYVTFSNSISRTLWGVSIRWIMKIGFMVSSDRRQ